ncbi:hypothetical protein GF366_02455 [Candidatus Peregrinibacteria bacterium]|nr:hypothetical protein [Candidatus Peregrinibacteria bacterium]
MNKMSVKIGMFALIAAILTTISPMALAEPLNGVEKEKFIQKKAEHHAMIKESLENGDYEAFLAAIPEDAPIAEKITEEIFERMVEAHKYMKSGDFESAKEIMDGLGFKRPFKKKMKNKFKKKKFGQSKKKFTGKFQGS